MPKKKTNNEPKFTIQGEWFPEIYPAFRAQKWSRSNEDPLTTEMRLFCSCQRWAFNRLLEGSAREDLKKQGQQIFGLNSRFCDDVILKAKAIIESQKELLILEIAETETKFARTSKKLSWAKKDMDKAIEKNDPSKIEKAKRIVHGRKARLKKITDKLNELKTHQENGTIPKVIFGGRSLWKRVCKGRASNKEWQQARQNRLYSRGDETKGGNPNLRISYRNKEFTLSVVISHLTEPGKVDNKDVQHSKWAPRVTGKLWLPEKHRLKVWELLLSGAPYTVELIKGKDSRYRAHIAFTVQVPELVTNPNRGCLGMDTNPDGVALVNVNYTGQPEPWLKDFAPYLIQKLYINLTENSRLQPI